MNNPDAKSPEAVELAKHPLAVVNDLILRAFNAQKRLSLIFLIINDTHSILKYDRAILWRVEKKTMKIMGISGQSFVNPYAELYVNLTRLVKGFRDPSVPRLLSAEDFTNKEVWDWHQKRTSPSILWLPIVSDDQVVLGLWLENWNAKNPQMPPPEKMELLNRYLLPGYAAAWKSLKQRLTYDLEFRPNIKKKTLAIVASLIALSFLIRIPIRIAVPCEVVLSDPTFITAPIEGVIEKVAVQPGSQVKKGETLVEYNKEAALQEEKVSKSEVQILQAQLNRAITLQLENKPAAGEEIATLELKLKKEKLRHNHVIYQLALMTIKSPEDGVAIIDDPDKWSGKPVQIGEKIMTVSNPEKTKIKLWIPEKDNINLNLDIPISVYLNVSPELNRPAKVSYISHETVLSEKNVPSFVAGAEWLETQPDAKPGLQGAAVLYGEKVSFFYYVLRKPWAVLRNLTGF